MCVSERCQLMNTNMRNVHAVRNLHPFTEYDVLGGIILTLMFWKYLCMSLLTEMDPLMTMNQYIKRDCTCMIQIKPKLTVKLPFSNVETVDIMTLLLFSTNWKI